MTTVSLSPRVRWALDWYSRLVAERPGGVPAILVGRDKDGALHLVEMKWEDEEQKARRFFFASIYFACYDIEEYLLLTEAWVLKRTVEEQKADEKSGSSLSPSEHPDRTSALMVLEVTRDASVAFNLDMPEPGKFGKVEQLSKVTGRMTRLLWSKENGPVSEAMRSTGKAMLNMVIESKRLDTTWDTGPVTTWH